MSIIGSNILAGSSGQGGAYQIEQSLRFNSADSAYLNRTPGSAGNRKTWTWSGWIKKGKLGSYQTIFSGGSTSPNYDALRFDNNDNLHFYQQGATTTNLTTTAVFRDPSAWYHVVLKLNSTASEAAIFVNGVEQTVTGTQPTNTDGNINNTIPHGIGAVAVSSTFDPQVNGYLAEVNFIDGSALDPEDFGEFDDNGVWRPIKYAGSYTGNSFYLKFANGDGTDSSGLSNTWTANNFTTSGTGTDVMSDTPTTNYATLNPLDTPNTAPTLSEGNLKWVTNTTSGNNTVSSSIYFPESEKWYVEVTVENYNTGSGVGYGLVGIGVPGSSARYLWWVYSSAQVQINTNSGLQNVGTVSVNDVIQVAYDASTREIWFGKNNTWYLSGDPDNGTPMSPAASVPSGLDNVRFYLDGRTGLSTNRLIVNFGQRDFAYTPPTNFLPLNTANLPAPDIADGSDYFNTVLYTGNGSTQSITGVGFQPDWVWMKSRTEGSANYIGHNVVQDAVRGTGTNTALVTNENYSESGTGYSDALTAFNSDGFSLGSRNQVNYSGHSFVSWNWLAGGSGSSNTDGSITSTVSANPTAGFSIVSYDSNPTGTVGHGLGVAPELIIEKKRDVAGDWLVTTNAIDGSLDVLRLNKPDQAVSAIISAPTSTVFTPNASSDSMIAYCFASVQGYSKFGSYTGNGSTDGPFVHCGFRPAFVIIKSSSSVYDWFMFDNKRDPENIVDLALFPNSSSAESGGSTYMFDFTSNGIKIRNSQLNLNGSGSTYIFAAFAEHPFGGSGVSPATAR